MGGFLLQRARVALVVGAPAALAACSSGPLSVGDNRIPISLPDSGPDIGAGGTMDAAGDVADALAPPTPGDLISITASCAKQISGGLLARRPNGTVDVAICQLSNAIFWTSGLAVMCAGKTTTTCNPTTDTQFQPTTTAKDSNGDSLDAAALPYVEVSAPSSLFDYTNPMWGLKMGTVVAVVNRNKTLLEYGILGTVGQKDIIGDASYAMASSLGVNPDPAMGGTGGGITYIAFTGPSAVVSVNENHDEAVRLGEVAAAALVQAGK